jgi:glyoxylase-like metal-dependent hydrolase (beta-lactamase superfamily II)
VAPGVGAASSVVYQNRAVLDQRVKVAGPVAHRADRDGTLPTVTGTAPDRTGPGTGRRVEPVDDTIIDFEDAGTEVHRVVVGPVDNNVYIVRCKQTGDAVLIDAANEHDRLLGLCRTLGVRSVVETHGHWDHIQAVTAVRDAGIDVAVTRADAAMLPSYDQILEDDSTLQVGRLRIDTIATPGHTPGSMCFAVQGTPLLFTGDTLFPGGPGNTSFENADFDTIISSIERRLFAAYGPDTLVLPGHGDQTTIGRETPHLQEWIDRGW